LGAIEGNVDKLIANRMKKRGMSWTKRGGNRMARLINLRERGQLHSWINYLPQKPKSIPLAEKRLRRSSGLQTRIAERGSKLDCQLFVGHTVIIPGFRFSGQ
jgi:hypothetical protein